jgi:hypothetical protein
LTSVFIRGSETNLPSSASFMPCFDVRNLPTLSVQIGIDRRIDDVASIPIQGCRPGHPRRIAAHFVGAHISCGAFEMMGVKALHGRNARGLAAPLAALAADAAGMPRDAADVPADRVASRAKLAAYTATAGITCQFAPRGPRRQSDQSRFEKEE